MKTCVSCQTTSLPCSHCLSLLQRHTHTHQHTHQHILPTKTIDRVKPQTITSSMGPILPCSPLITLPRPSWTFSQTSLIYLSFPSVSYRWRCVESCAAWPVCSSASPSFAPLSLVSYLRGPLDHQQSVCALAVRSESQSSERSKICRGELAVTMHLMLHGYPAHYNNL